MQSLPDDLGSSYAYVVLHWLSTNIIFFIQKEKGETKYFETDELTFTAEETTLLKKITSVKFQAKLNDNFGHGFYNGTLILENAKGMSSVTQIFLVVDAWFGKWSQWSHCSISCIDEIQPILGEKFDLFLCFNSQRLPKICCLFNYNKSG